MTTTSPGVPKAVIASVAIGAVLFGFAAGIGVLALRAEPASSPVAAGSATPLPSVRSAEPNTPVPSVSAPATPTPLPTASLPPALLADVFAQVAVNELNLRAEPRTAAVSEGRLFAGARVFVLEGPQQSDGYGWYRVMVAEGPYTPVNCEGYGCDARQDIGWVAGVSQDRNAWLTATELGCPSSPPLAQLTSLDPLERLACYGNEQLTVEGTIETPCCGYVGPYVHEPAWLANPTPVTFFAIPYLGLRYDPARQLVVPARGDVVRVTGHFDDPQAAGCTAAIGGPWLDVDANGNPIEEGVEPPDIDRVRMLCRMEFVIEAIIVIGHEDLGPCCG